MGVGDYIAIAAIVVILGLAIFYVVRAKKNGQKCIGCPSAKTCSGNCGSCGSNCPHCKN